MIRAFKPLPRRPRYEYAKKKAYELLSDLDIREYPIDIFNIYKAKLQYQIEHFVNPLTS